MGRATTRPRSNCPWLPAMSLATTVRVCGPRGTPPVSQSKAKSPLVTLVSVLPSNRYSTSTTSPGASNRGLSVTRPPTVWPSVGESMATVTGRFAAVKDASAWPCTPETSTLTPRVWEASSAASEERKRSTY